MNRQDGERGFTGDGVGTTVPTQHENWILNPFSVRNLYRARPVKGVLLFIAGCVLDQAPVSITRSSSIVSVSSPSLTWTAT